MGLNLPMEVSEVSDNPSPKSDIRSEKSERSPMSSAAEMTTLIRVVASPAVPGESVKAVIARAARRLGFTYSRTRGLYYGEARRIDAAEIDRAREVARKHEATDRALAHEVADEYKKLGDRIARLEALLLSGPYSYGAGVAPVEQDGGPRNRTVG